MPEDQQQSTELAVRPSQGSAIMPIDPQEMKLAQQQHQELVQALLDPSDWQGQPNADGSFVKKSGWRKIAAGYSLSFKKIDDVVERDDSGMPLRASYTAACIAPNGRVVEATGHCAYAESRFSGSRGNTSKLENDMRATAETRAKNRACSDIIGMGKVSAEEVNAGHPDAGPTYGPAAPATTADKTREAIAYMLTDPREEGGTVEPGDDLVTELLGELEGKFGYMPYASVYTIARLVAKAREAFGDAPAEEPAPDVIDGTATERLTEEQADNAHSAAEAEVAAAETPAPPVEGTSEPQTPDTPPVEEAPPPAADPQPPIGSKEAGDSVEW